MKPEELITDTKAFINSDYGKYIIEQLEAMQRGYEASAENPKELHPVRYLDRSVTIKEVLSLIYSPIEL
jgi:hypothetical protein